MTIQASTANLPVPRPAEALFSPGERWGWAEYDPVLLRLNFTPAAAPAWPPPELAAKEARLARSQKRAERRPAISSFGGMGLWILLSALLVHPWGAAPDFYVLGAFSFVLMWAFVTLLLMASVRRAKRAISDVRLRWVAQTAEHSASMERMQADLDASENARLATLPRWCAVRPPQHRQNVCVFGGTTAGWQGLLITLVTSMLGSGQSVTILDLTEADIPARLFAILEKNGRRGVKTVFPQDAATFDPFASMGAPEIADLLAEAIHSNDPESMGGEELAMDERLLQTVCTKLGERRVTLQRIAAGLHVALRRPRDPWVDDVLSETEQDQLAVLFNNDDRGILAQRAVVIEASLQRIVQVGSAPKAPDDSPEPPSCRCISVSQRSGALAGRLLTNLLVQFVIRELRDSRSAAHASQVLIVAGAERVPPRELERLSSLSERTGLRIVQLFRRFDEATADTAGASGSLTAIMRLNSQRDAERAADFIGKVHRFERSQVTTSQTTGYTKQWGTSWSDNPRDHTEGGQTGTATMSQGADAETQVRVYEHAIPAEVLRGLEEHELWLVDFVNRERYMVSASCDSDLGLREDATMQTFDQARAAIEGSTRQSQVARTGQPPFRAFSQGPPTSD